MYRDSGNATVTPITTPPTGVRYAATISGLAETTAANGWSGRRVYADTDSSSNDRAAFGENKVTVYARGANTLTVKSDITPFTAGTIWNVSLV